VQCGHELKLFGYKLGDWSNRWFSNSTYCKKVQNIFRTGFFDLCHIQSDPVDEDDADVEFDFETNDECTAEVVEMVVGRAVGITLPQVHEEDDNHGVLPVVQFSELVSTFRAIASHAQHDQPEMVKLHAFAKGVLSSYRNGLSVNVEFTTDGQASCLGTATSKVLTTASRQKRFRSYLEGGRARSVSKRTKVGANTTCFRDETNKELNSMVSRKAKGTKSCTICLLNKGHTAFTCDLVVQYGGVSFRRNDKLARMTLVSDLVNNQRFVIDPLPVDDVRHALKSLPKSVKAMILHRKCSLGRDIVIETTLIREGCVDEEYTCVLFQMDAITGWLPTSQQKPLVNLIPIDRSDPSAVNQSQQTQRYNEQPAFAAAFAQQAAYSQYQISQQYSQLSQMSQTQLSQHGGLYDPNYYDGGFASMGFGGNEGQV
jgi:hypothetical protein